MLFLEQISTLSLVGVFVSALVIFVTFFKWRFTYWKKRGVPQLSPIIPFGDMKELFLQKCSIGDQYTAHYQQMKAKKLKYAGIYFSFKPTLVVADLELTKKMLITDFSHFVNHGIFLDKQKDPLSGHLFNLEGNEWKSMRQKLTPTFTSGKIKTMFDTINNCSLGITTIMEESCKNRTPVDIKELMCRFSTDVIGSVAFGIECNSLKDPNCEFRHYGRKIFQANFLEKIKLTLLLTLPKFLLKRLPLKMNKKDVEVFFMNAVRKMVYMRETKHIYRKDFLQLLVELKNPKNSIDFDKSKIDGGNDALTMNEVAAQAFIFFIAGFETTSTTLNFTMFELAMNPAIQEKLRDEVRTVLAKHNGQISYDALTEMVYMDNVIYETLRKYPPVQALNRVCTKDYNIPGTSAWVEKGTTVMFAIEGMQHDPMYYPDPQKFDPERYTDEDKSNRPWMPFGEGPRICIGMRFAMVEMKISLTNILNNFRLKLNSKTKTPLTYVTGVFIKTVNGSIYMDIEKV